MPKNNRTITNDIVFSIVMEEYKNLAKQLVAKIVNKDLSELKDLTVEQQKTRQVMLQSKGIRFDIYMAGEHRVIDTEMQTSKQQDLVSRSRYYVSVNDCKCLGKGMNYSKLPETIIIFICTFDPFGMKYAKYITHEGLYTDDQYKNEVSKKAGYDNKVTKIFLNASKDVKYWNASEDLKNVLQYISTQKPTDAFTSQLQEAVVDVCNKKEEEIMDLERYVAEKEFLAAEKAATQVIKDFLKAGVPIKEVIKATKLSPEKVNELLEEIKEEHS